MRSTKAFTMIEVMIVLSVFVIIVSIAVPTYLRARTNSRARGCQENLSKIAGAIQNYALDYDVPSGGAVTMVNLVQTNRTGYLRSTPACPEKGEYVLTTVDVDPTCTWYGNEPTWAKKHILQN